jgi:transposase
VGQTRIAANPAGRPALRECLSVRRHLPRSRHRRGTRAALPDTQATQLHLNEISRAVARGAHAVLLLDRAGWHTTGNLVVPKNMTLTFLPSRAPELNPVENVWQYLRQNWLSNRVFDTYEAIIDAACEAWRKLVAQPEIITSIGLRDWAHVGQR